MRDSFYGFALRSYYRYAVVPREGRPIVFGGLDDTLAGEAGIDAREGRTWDFFPVVATWRRPPDAGRPS